MPRTYVREWVADMMATGYGQKGHVDITEFLNQAGPSWTLHPITIVRLNQIMLELGYRLGDGNWTFREWEPGEREAWEMGKDII